MHKEIFPYFQERREEMVSFLRGLVMVESGSYQKEGLYQLGQILAQRLMQIGFSCERYQQKEYGDHLLLEKKGKGEGSLLLLGHMDTVFHEGITQEFPFTREGKYAYGPGVCDMKGGLVNLVYGMEALVHLDYSSYGNITIFINSDEELGSPSSQSIIEGLVSRVQGAFILEPARSDGSLVIQRKGLGQGLLKVTGQAAHAGSKPEAGVNAIEELAHQILSLASLQDLSAGISINIGSIKGGTRINVVPHKAQAALEFRFFQKEDGEEVLRNMKEQVHKKRFEGSIVELEAEIHRLPMEKTKGVSQLFSLVKEAGESLGITIKEQRTGGLSDGNILSGKVPLVDAMGPIGSHCHSQKEELLIESLPERAALLVLSIIKFFSHRHS